MEKHGNVADYLGFRKLFLLVFKFCFWYTIWVPNWKFRALNLLGGDVRRHRFLSFYHLMLI